MGLTGCSPQNWDFVAKGDNPKIKSWSSSLRIGRKASYGMGYFYQTFGNISFAMHTLHNHYSFDRIHFSKKLSPTCSLLLEHMTERPCHAPALIRRGMFRGYLFRTASSYFPYARRHD